MSDSLWTLGLQHARLLCPSLSPGVCSNSCPLSQWCYLTISYSTTPFSCCLQSFPASRSFPMSWTWIHGPNLPSSYAISFFTALDFTFTTRHSTTEHHFCFGPAASFFLELLVIALCSSPVAYWTPSNLGGLISWCHIFLSFHTVHKVLMERILEWFTISSSSGPRFVITSLWPVGPGWPCMVWLTELHKPLPHDKCVMMKGFLSLPSLSLTQSDLILDNRVQLVLCFSPLLLFIV